MALTTDAAGTPSPRGAEAAAELQRSLTSTAELSERRTGAPVVLPGVELLGERAAITGMRRTPGGTVGGATRTLRAAAGWWVLAIARPDDYELVAALTETAGGGDPWDVLASWSATQPAAAAAERAQLLGLAAADVPTGTGADPQLAHRGGVPVRRMEGGARPRRAVAPLVVDLSSLWAGPLCAHLLGLGGAHVVKVESSRRLDGARHGAAEFYDLLHAGHDSVTVDLTTARGRAQLADLIAGADVVIESSRPRAMRQLGVDVAACVDAGVIWTSITAYGRTGPWSDRIGFGDDVAAAAGLVAELDGVPVPVGDAIADPLAGARAAAETAAALLSDNGRLIDVSMCDVAREAAGRESAATVARYDEGWVVRGNGGEEHRVGQPVARRPTGVAAAPGAHNDRYLAAMTQP
jgi:hypothetical protein